MRYMLLIYNCDRPKPEDPGFAEALARVNAFADECRRRGALVAGDPLHSENTATTVSVRDGRTLITVDPIPGSASVTRSSDSLARLRPVRTRSISPENFTGEKGKGGMSADGPAAASPEALHVQDWSREPWTAPRSVHALADYSLFGHPLYQQPALGGRLHWASTETATDHAGHIEGALFSGERAAHAVLSSATHGCGVTSG